MMTRIESTASFNKAAKQLQKRYKSFLTDLQALVLTLTQTPTLGTDLGGGLRKVRMPIKSKGRGKSGGARVITFIFSETASVVKLLYIYDKADRESISKKELLQLLKQNELQ